MQMATPAPSRPIMAAVKEIYYHLYSNSNLPRAERLANEFVKLLFCKYYDEVAGSKEIGAGANTTPATFRRLFVAARQHWPGLFPDGDELLLNDNGLEYVGKVLPELTLVGASEDVLGQAFQTFLGPSIRGEKGQFFTPKIAADVCVRLIPPQDGDAIVDPACGTGTFLASAVEASRKAGNAINCFGSDRESDLVRLCKLHLSFLGQAIEGIQCADSLDLANWKGGPGSVKAGEVDAIYTNPPFGARIKVTSPDILSQYELGHKWAGVGGNAKPTSTLLDGQDPQVLFVELCVKLLRDGGRCAIVLPEGIITGKSSAPVRAFLDRHTNLLGVLDCPRELFQPCTDVKSVILVFEKGEPSNKPVFMSHVKYCGHDRRGRTVLDGEGGVRNEFDKIASLNPAQNSTRLSFSVPRPPGQYEGMIPRFKWHEEALGDADEKIAPDFEWRTLGDLVADGVLSMGRGREPGAKHYTSEGIRFVRTSDIDNFEVAAKTTKHVDPDYYHLVRDKDPLEEGDILFVADGRYRIGKCCILTEHDLDIMIQSHVKIIRVQKRGELSPWLLFALLAQPRVQAQIQSLVGVTTTIGSIGPRLAEVRIPIPRDPAVRSHVAGTMRDLMVQRAEALRAASDLVADLI